MKPVILLRLLLILTSWVWIALVPSTCYAQWANENEWLHELAQYIGLNEEEGLEAWEASIAYLLEHPKEINSVTSEELKEIPLLSEFQIVRFIQERHRRGGRFTSIYDLKSIPSWNIELVRLLAPFFTMDNSVSASSIPSFPSSPSGSVYIASRISHSSSSNDYLGSPHSVRIGFHQEAKNRFSVGGFYKKSAYERYFVAEDLMQPALISLFYTQKFQNRKVQTLTIGDFGIQIGAGLTAHTSSWGSLSSGAWNSLIHNRLHGNNSSIRSSFLRGVAIEGSLYPTWHFQWMAALTPIDASIEKKSGEIVRFIPNPLRRTAKDEAMYHTARIYSTIGHLYQTNDTWIYGIAFCGYSFGKYHSHYLPNYSALFSPEPLTFFSNTSFYYNYSEPQGKWEFSGEMAMDHNRSLATIHSAIFRQENYNLSLQGRYLQEKYQALYGKSQTARSTLGNEQGFRASWEHFLPHRITLRMMYDQYQSSDNKRTYYGHFWQGSLLHEGQRLGYFLQVHGTASSHRPLKYTLKFRIDFKGSDSRIRLETQIRKSKKPDLYGYSFGGNVQKRWNIAPSTTSLLIRSSLYYYHAASFLTAQYPYLRMPSFSGYFQPFYGEGVIVGVFLQYERRLRWQGAYYYNRIRKRNPSSISTLPHLFALSVSYRWR